MQPHRKIILALTLLLAGGSLSFTAAYGLRLRSDAYRHEVEAELSSFFNLPSEIGRIRGRTFSSRAFEDVTVHLPDRRDRVFSCKTAIWHETTEDGNEVNELDLLDGVLILGSDRWQRGDYRQLIKSGLGHDFGELHLSKVTLSRFEIGFERGSFSIRCGRASGTIDMDSGDEGVAYLNAYELNGFPIGEGVRIHARFCPKNGVEVSELTLSVPEVPLASTGIGPALKTEITHGRFAGRIQYVNPKGAEKPEVWISGDLIDADLAELTCGVPMGPFEGEFSVNVDRARLSDSVITHFYGRGVINNLSFSSFAPLLKLQSLSGSASLNLDVIDIALGHVNRLRLDGRARGLALQELLQRWGQGSASGMLAIRINNLDVVDDNIKSADIEITVLPPEGRPGTIDRTLLLGLAKQVLDFTWPSAIPQNLLPKQLAYTQFGARLLVRDNQLRILGTHGNRGDTILTIKVFGRDFGLVKEQPDTIDLKPYLSSFLERIRGYDPDRMRLWWGATGL